MYVGEDTDVVCYRCTEVILNYGTVSLLVLCDVVGTLPRSPSLSPQ
jgi:hypothetical protein